ncbi:MAG: WYL domain-containing protein [Hydrogenophaga sp.]|uniref:helix-turn-helix transcriptional regulator n=1 Tax=Hydrogenophaga sp. TaxID=1904254 RepID=UPI0027216A55|nr:WYL domain-containing protein [Hydrogenophaga sp.]MDO9567759.1 WYL domain-containing protein [Hydrogenophaga sp.]
MNKTDRIYHLAAFLRTRRRTTLAELQAETGASRATLMRDLAWLRNGLNHPIHWDREAQCYHWRASGQAEDAPEELAGLWFKPSEVLALLTLEHLLREIQPGDLMQRHLQPLEQRLKKILRQSGLDSAAERQLSERIRVIGLGQRQVPPQSFETVGLALSQRRRLAMQYQARGTGEHSERTVSPQRLVYYRSNWLLDAWCHKRNELRSFSLDAIRHPVVLDEPAINVDTEELNQTLGNGYGIFSGKAVQWASLRFTPERARWVAAEQWHPEQKGEWDAQGHWVLQIPYSDDRELVMDILRHTPEVEVLAPPALRAAVVKKMREGLKRLGDVA